MKKKIIKAWAVVGKDNGKFITIGDTKATARTELYRGATEKGLVMIRSMTRVIPCEIILNFPQKTRLTIK